MTVFTCPACGLPNTTHTSTKCTGCGLPNAYQKSALDKRRKEALTDKVNDVTVDPRITKKSTDYMNNDTGRYDPHKNSRRYNTDCGGQTEFDMVVGEGVYATRSWERDSLGRLVSPTKHHIWKPGVNVSDGHGFYAYTDKPTFSGKVKGVILASGKVEYGTRGCIAEKATIVAIHEPLTITGFKPLTILKKVGAVIAHRIGSDKAQGGPGIGFHVGITVASLYTFLYAVVAAVAATTLLSTGLFALLAATTGLLAVSMIMSVGLTTKKYRELMGDKSAGSYSLKELYPDVKFYTNEKKMLKDFGLPNNYTPPEPEVPKPTDEEFWKMTV